jgi:type III pantothenate kinase
MEGAPRVVATGGHAALIADATRTIEIVNPDLTLEGLRMLFERSQKAAPGESVDRH